MDESYSRLAAYLNVNEDEVQFGPSITQNLYVLAQAFRELWNEGDDIIIDFPSYKANIGGRTGTPQGSSAPVFQRLSPCGLAGR